MQDVYYIVEGKIALYPETTKRSQNNLTKTSQEIDQPINVTAGEYCGQEMTMQSEHYIHKAVITAPVTLIRIPAPQFYALFQKHPRIVYNFTKGFLSRFTTLSTQNQLFSDSHPSDNVSSSSWAEVIKWIVIFITGLALTIMSTSMIIDQPTFIFASLAFIAFALWGLNLLPAYVAAILIVTVLLTTGVAPPAVVLSGFISEPFFMALTIYCLGTVVVSSGILYRMMLIILKYMPQSQRWSKSYLFLIGIIVNVTVPSTRKRQQVMQTNLNDMIAFTSQTYSNPAVHRLAISSFIGSSLFNSVLLSGSLLNFAMLGFLSQQDQLRFQWSGWLQTVSVVGGILLATHVIFIIGASAKDNQNIIIDRPRIDHQYRVLGKTSYREWGAISALLIFIIGTLTADIHRLPPTLLGLFIMLFLTGLNVIDRHMFHKNIDWPSLFFLAVIIGFYNTMAHLHITATIAHHLSGIGEFIKNNFYIFVVGLAVVMMIIRLIMPFMPTVLLAMAIVLPIAQDHEMSPWIMGFLVLLFGHSCFFAYQFSWLKITQSTLASSYDEFLRKFLSYNAVINVIKVIAALASIPFWIKLGLI